MVLTREEKERLVLDLYNQGKSTREIAEEARMSFRDIGAILEKSKRGEGSKQGQAQQVSHRHKHTNYSLKVNLQYK